jgi:predicted TIM-barrel fold metal-dependent hydrolase
VESAVDDSTRRLHEASQERTVTSQGPDRLLISADAHVQENDDTWARIPEPLRRFAPTVTEHPNGDFTEFVEGRTIEFDERNPDPEKEFRHDPSGGVDLASRRRDMVREGVDANVVFPNDGLSLGIGDAPAEYRRAHARAYNDWVCEVFSDDPKRFKPVGLIPIDDVESAVAETEHCLKLGLSSVGVAAVVPWRPYFLPYWEPLWSLVEESGLLLNFHIFTGNLGFGADFAWVHHMPQSDFDIAKEAREANERAFADYGGLSAAVLGVASGMSPIVHLIGGGVLDRHPELRFIVTEAESGWLSWLLFQMDFMSDRFKGFGPTLSMKPSEFFARQGAVSFTDDPVAIRNVCDTGSERLLWSNDYPHTEGTFPRSKPVVDSIVEQLPRHDAENILFRNAARLYGFDLEYLEAHPLS